MILEQIFQWRILYRATARFSNYEIDSTPLLRSWGAGNNLLKTVEDSPPNLLEYLCNHSSWI